MPALDPRLGLGGPKETTARTELIDYAVSSAPPTRAVHTPAYMFVQAAAEALSRMEPEAKRDFYRWLHGDAFRESVCLGEDDEQVFRRVLAILDGIAADRTTERAGGAE